MISNYHGLGDTSSDISFAEGATFTSFIVGVGLIILFKTMLSSDKRQSTKSDRVWASGAYRSPDSASYYQGETKLRGRRRGARTSRH